MNVLLLLLLSGSVLLRDSILSRFDNDSKFAEKMSLCGNTLSLDLCSGMVEPLANFQLKCQPVHHCHFGPIL